MDTNDILKSIENVDKEIANIYELIKEKELNNELFEQEIAKLKELLIVEDYLYSKLDITDDEYIKLIYTYLNRIPSYSTIFSELHFNLCINKKTCSSEQLMEMINLRIYNRLIFLNQSKIKNLYEESTIDEKTGIYLPNNICEIRNLSESEYLKKVNSSKEKVYAFNEEVKTYLINNADVDITTLEIIFLELGKNFTQMPTCFINEIYGLIFVDKEVEKRVIFSDFNIDKMLKNLYVKDKCTNQNQKFVYWYRSHRMFEYIKQLIICFSNFNNNCFDINNKLLLYNNVIFQINILKLKSSLCLLNEYDYKQLQKENVLKIFEGIEELTYTTKILKKEIGNNNYQKLKEIINL